MNNRRTRSLFLAAIALAIVWGVAMVAFMVVRSWKVTAAKVSQFESTVDLDKLQPADRAKDLRKLEDLINAMPADERRRWRTEEDWKRIYGQMTEEERGQFIDATLPSGLKQMMDTFASMPEEQRKQVIDDAIRNLHEGRPSGGGRPDPNYGSNGPPPLSPELENKVRQLGLKAYYSSSSAEMKVELAPLMEEIQNQIQNGANIR